MRADEGGKPSNTRLLSHFETQHPEICSVCSGSDLDLDGFCWDCEAIVVNKALADIADLLGESAD